MQHENRLPENNTSNPATMSLQFKTLKGEKASLSLSTREYMRQYYMKNREKALEYQREYYRKHKCSLKKTVKSQISARDAVKQVFTSYDIMQLSTEKAIRTLNKIMRGDREFIG